MVLNYIWISFFIVAFLVALLKTFMGDLEIFSLVVNSIFERAELGFKLSLGLTGIMALWLGIMRIGEKGGAINILSKIFAPLFNRLFPEIPKGHPASGAIMLNYSANMLGLDNAATPALIVADKLITELGSVATVDDIFINRPQLASIIGGVNFRINLIGAIKC